MATAAGQGGKVAHLPYQPLHQVSRSHRFSACISLQMWNSSQKAEDQIEELFNITSAMCIGGVWGSLRYHWVHSESPEHSSDAVSKILRLPCDTSLNSEPSLCSKNKNLSWMYAHILFFFFFFSILWVIIFVLTKPEQAEQLWISPKLSESRHNPHTKLLCAKTQHEETGMAESSWGTLLGTEKPAGGVRRLLCISRAAWCPPSELLAASRAHRIEVVGRDLWRSLSPTPC